MENIRAVTAIPQYLRALALANGEVMGALEGLKSQYGPSAAPTALARKAASILDASDAATARAANRGFLQLMASQSLLARISGFTPMPADTQVLRQTADVAASWTAENVPITVSAPDLTPVQLAPKKLGCLVAQTRELFQVGGSVFEQALVQALVRALAKVENGSFIDPANAGDAATPASITHGIAATAATGTPSGDFAALCGAFTGDLSGAALVTTPRVGIALRAAGYDGAGAKGGDIAGVPLFTSAAVPAGLQVLVDPARIGVWDGGDVDVTLANAASITADDGAVISLFEANLVGVRAVRSVSWMRLADAAVVWTRAS